MYRKMIFLSVLFLFLTGCGPLLGDVQIGIETPDAQVQVTDEPLVVTQEPLPTEEPSPAPELMETPTEAPAVPGTVSGNICFPSEMIPAMTAFFEETTSGTLFELAIVENQSTYVIELPAGEYVAFAYPEGDAGAGFGGMYSKAAQCGLGIGCTDHAPLPFVVEGESAIGDIDLCDWYSPGDVPVNPNASLQVDPELAGLVYRSNNAIWLVDSNGKASPILNAWDVEISPDGRYAAYDYMADLFVADLQTGVNRNLTNTPDRIEGGAVWIPGTPPAIMFSSQGVDEEVGMSGGPISTISLDGTGYQVLNDVGSVFFGADPSPDGQSIVYSRRDTGWFYRLGGVIEEFFPSDYGLENVERVAAVSWSPDGTRLAWWVGGDLESSGENKSAIAIVDLENQTTQLLHIYTPIGGSPGPSPSWSPNGEWIISHVLGEGSKGSLWAMRVDGSEEYEIGNAGDFIWRSDSQAIVYVRWPDNGGPAWDATLEIVEVGEWTPRQLSAPLGISPVAWFSGE